MIPQLILSLAAPLVITPGAVPVVHNIHPDETAWVEEIKEARPEPLIVMPHAHSPRPPAPMAPDWIEAMIQTLWLEPDWDWARRVGRCESSWNANAYNPSGAAGLWQFMPSTWEWVALDLGFPSYADGGPYDPALNAQAAAYLYYHPTGGPGRWVCK